MYRLQCEHTLHLCAPARLRPDVAILGSMEEVLDKEVLDSIRDQRVLLNGADEDAVAFEEVRQKLAAVRTEIGRRSRRVSLHMSAMHMPLLGMT